MLANLARPTFPIVQATNGDSAEAAFAGQGCNGPGAALATKAGGIELVLVKLPQAKGFCMGFVPRRAAG